MNGIQAITRALAMSQSLWERLIDDMTEADMLVRPFPDSNHAAWQLGHIIAAEVRSHPQIGAVTPVLPDQFIERHAMERNRDTSNEGFLTKQEYMKTFASVREATLAAMNKLSEADLDKPNTGAMAQMAPTIGAVLVLIATHGVMHVGQLSVIRRKLGKPVKF